MYADMNNQLQQLKQDIYRYKNLDLMLKKLKVQLLEEESKQSKLELILEKENLDVENFSKMTISNLFYTILGSKEEQLEKEKSEVLAAKFKLDDINKQIEETKAHISKLGSERSKVSNAQFKYDELYEVKYKLLKENEPWQADKIIQLEDEIALYKSNLKEIREAIIAGNSVRISLDKVEKSLKSAKNWGTWDLIGGDGLITNMVKHNHIDDARDAVSEVQSKLNRFTTELTDVNVSSSITIDIGGFTKFADFFFDGLISDWVVQSKIRDSQESVENVRRDINKVLANLSTMKSNDEKRLTALESELSRIILNAN